MEWLDSIRTTEWTVTRKVTRGGVNRPGRELLSGLKILVPFLLWLLTKTHHILLYLPRHSNTRPPLLALVSNYYCYTWRRGWFNEPRSCLYCFVFVFIVNIFHLVSLYFFVHIPAIVVCRMTWSFSVCRFVFVLCSFTM